MFNFKNLAKKFPPDQWIYKYYLNNFKINLDGSAIRLFSVFNAERTPSLFLYVKGGKYIWYDHSKGKGGDAIGLARAVIEHSVAESITNGTLISTINYDYSTWKAKNGEFISSEISTDFYAYDVIYSATSKLVYSELELIYWKDFGIAEPLLKRYNIASIHSFTLGRRTTLGDRTTENWGRTRNCFITFGFYIENGELVKIYSPLDSNYKHITLKNVTLGREQLEPHKHRTLIIASSMKDMLVLKTLGLEIDVIAPIGEKVLIPADEMNDFKNLYKNIFTMFDNDRTGIKAMLMYEAIYGIDFIYCPHYKDVAEFRSKTSADKVRTTVTSLINKKIFKPLISEQDDNTAPWWNPTTATIEDATRRLEALKESKEEDPTRGHWTREGWVKANS